MRIEARILIEGIPPGEKTSPGEFATVPREQGLALVGLGLAYDRTDPEASEAASLDAPAEAPAPTEVVVEPLAFTVEGDNLATEDAALDLVVEPAAEVVSEPAAEVVSEPAAEVVSEPAAEEATDRTADILAAIELLDADDFVKTGPRAGHPKVAAVEAVFGSDLTADEVDAAFALRESAE